MDLLGIVLVILGLGLQSYVAQRGGTVDQRKARYEESAITQPALHGDMFSTLKESTHLSFNLFQRLAVVEQLQDEQAVKMGQQDREIMLLKQQIRDQQQEINEQQATIEGQTTTIKRHERQITKLRALLKEMGKEISDEELAQMANDTAR